MTSPDHTAAVLAAAILFLPAHAASGSLDSFSASAIEVLAGSRVDFSVAYRLDTSAWSPGGSLGTLALWLAGAALLAARPARAGRKRWRDRRAGASVNPAAAPSAGAAAR